MRNLLIDSRMRDVEKDYLKTLNYKIIELPLNEDLYAEISGHPDIQVSIVENNVIQAPNSSIKLNNAIIGDSKIEGNFPGSIHYNVCSIGKFFIHNLNYTDKKVLEQVNKLNMIKIHVNQGYTKCSIAVTSDNSCITTDKQICETLKKYNIDCIYVDEPNIHLLDKNKKESKMNGFIGGATAILDDKFILFGDKKYLNCLEIIEEHLKKYNLEFIDFPEQLIYDYGGIIQI